MVPEPVCDTTADTSGSSSACGTNGAAATLAGRRPRIAGSIPGPVVTAIEIGRSWMASSTLRASVGVVEDRAQGDVDQRPLGQLEELPGEPLVGGDLAGARPDRPDVHLAELRRTAGPVGTGRRRCRSRRRAAGSGCRARS